MKMFRLVTTVLVLSFVLVFLSGCSAAPGQPQAADLPPSATQAQSVESPTPAPTEPPVEEKRSTPSATPLPAPTETPVPTSTPTPLPSPTATSTATHTPTPQPQGMVPGIYQQGGCIENKLTANVHIDFCVINVRVTQMGDMVFTVSWKATFAGSFNAPTKRSDVGNPNMYIVDNLGNHYNSIGVGGAAAERVRFGAGTTYIGTFTYPSAQPGAHLFTFVDSDQNISIANIDLTAPDITEEALALQHYPTMRLLYWSDKWSGSVNDQGQAALTSLQVPGCQIIEWEPSEVVGKYKNTLPIGAVTYSIYGWAEPENNWSVREYLVVEGIEAPEPLPLFHAVIPMEGTDQCLMDASDVLGTLHLLED